MSSASSLPIEAGKGKWKENESAFSADEKQVAQLLIDNDQAHLFAAWSASGDLDKKKAFLAQVKEINSQYPGGVAAYVKRAKNLLRLAAIGANPYEGFKASEPKDSVRLETAADFDRYEQLGLKEIAHTGFVIVAGGLGERLGYRGIKLAIPSEISTDTTFLDLYVQNILALQARARVLAKDDKIVLPFAIMTSDDTDAMTRDLLKKHNYFGMPQEQLTVFKQGKVPSMVDNDAHFCAEEGDACKLDTKPHGHGDVHMLLYQNGIIQNWVKQGVKWITFFQDTNGLVFRAIPAAVGVSAEKNLHMNSLTVPRVQGDAVGAICTLTREANAPVTEDSLPSPITINVEYNQLEGLLGKGVAEPTVAGTNWSVYPGNINVLVFNAIEYNKILDIKKGAISEFVNPKYNPDKQSFKKPTRLECMMQDYPKLLDGKANVGFAQFQRWTAFSAVKNAIADGAAKQKAGNAPEVAFSGETDMYYWGYKMLKDAGVAVADPTSTTFKSVTIELPPRIVLKPSFGVTQSEIRSRVPGGKSIEISARSTLILDGDITIKSLKLDGALVIRAAPGAKVVVDKLNVTNKGWEFVEVTDDSKVEQAYAIRGYTCARHETDEYSFAKGEASLSDETKSSHRKA